MLIVKEDVRIITAKFPDLSINKQLIIDADNEKPRDKNVSRNPYVPSNAQV